MLSVCAILLLLQAGPEEEVRPRPELRESTPESAPVPVKERYVFQTFGGDLLADSDLVADVRVESVIRAGPAVVVVRMTVEETHLLRGEGRPPSEVVTLAPPRDYIADQGYLVFLERLGSGTRYRSMRRLSQAERDFDAKRRVLRRYAELELVKDDSERARRIRDTLLGFLRDDELFVRWNALTELESFVENHKLLFDTPHRASIVAALRAEPSPTYRRRLMAVLEELGIRLEEGTDG